MSTVLGISAWYHDAAAAIVRDGAIVAAAQEERFSRRKHDPRFPTQAIQYCLDEAFIDAEDLDAVVFYDDPVATFDRALCSAVTVAPRGADAWVRGFGRLVRQPGRLRQQVQDAVGGPVRRLLRCNHHLAHAASAFYPSPFDAAAVLVIDGVGEWGTCSIGRADVGGIQLLEQVRYPSSLGLLYSAFTAFCGFRVNSGEYKLMGLAPYGTPRFADLIRAHLVDLRADGSLRLDMDAFAFLEGTAMAGVRFAELFEGPARDPADPVTPREADLAASVQVVVEEAVLALARRAVQRAGVPDLVMAGGVALNCVANGRVARESGARGLWVQPAAGDAGGALGAALLIAHELLGDPRPAVGAQGDRQERSLLGPGFSPAQTRAFLLRRGVEGEHVPDAAARVERIAAALDDGEVVGLATGRMEFGPRALGARSILADPRRTDMQARINVQIKRREEFRPFAPVVLAEHAEQWFATGGPSPYMLLVAPVQPARRTGAGAGALAGGSSLDDVLAVSRSEVPAVTHVNFSARVQTVAADGPPELRRILEAFSARTGCPVLLNTSFNVRGEPIVASLDDALDCFAGTDLDLLVLGEFLVRRASPRTRPARPLPPREDDPLEPALRALLAGPMAAVGERVRDGGPALLALRPDRSAGSYFEAPHRATLSDVALDWTGDLLADLAASWEGRADRAALVELLPALSDLARQLPQGAEKDDGPDDLPGHIYVMT